VTTTASTSDRLTVHRAVMAAVGPEGLADITGPATAREIELVAGFAARIAGMDDAELATRFGITPGMRADIEKAAR